MSYRIYECGHKQNIVIINTTVETLSTYLEWQSDESKNLCFDCWLKQRKDGSNKQ